MRINRPTTLAALAASALLAVGGTALAAAEFAGGEWEIGPVIAGRNYSQAMPPAPVPQGRGWYFDFPSSPGGSVHYLTTPTESLEGARRIVVRYRIEAERNARFIAGRTPDFPATVSLYLQRRGDGWSGKRNQEFYRWYSPEATMRELAPGLGEISVSLSDPNWISVRGHPASATPGQFADALRDAGRVGLVFGSRQARGHGVFSTAPARFTLESFRIE